MKIEGTRQFKRDFKREAKGRHQTTLQAAFIEVINALINNKPLAIKQRDHALTGEWNDYRDCHIKPDLVLIYRKPDNNIIQLVRLGSHSELGL